MADAVVEDLADAAAVAEEAGADSAALQLLLKTKEQFRNSKENPPLSTTLTNFKDQTSIRVKTIVKFHFSNCVHILVELFRVILRVISFLSR